MLWLFMFFLQWGLFYKALFGETHRWEIMALTTPMGVNGTMTQAGRRLQGTGPAEPWDYPNPASEEFSQDQAEAMQKMVAKMIPMIILSSLLSCSNCISQIVFMVMYKGKVHDQRPELIPDPSLADPLERFPLFGCFDDCDTCLHVYFCSLCRVGDTWGTANVMEYYMSIIALPFLPTLAGLAVSVLTLFEFLINTALPKYLSWFNTLTGWAVLVLMFGFFRNKLREKLGGVRGDTQKMIMDGVIWVFCACCATIQEARVVDDLNGVRVACCCKLTHTRQTEEYNQLVGPPLVVTGVVVQDNQK